MKLVKSAHGPATVRCAGCGRKMVPGNEPVWIDPEGPRHRNYWCPSCKEDKDGADQTGAQEPAPQAGLDQTGGEGQEDPAVRPPGGGERQGPPGQEDAGERERQ